MLPLFAVPLLHPHGLITYGMQKKISKCKIEREEVGRWKGSGEERRGEGEVKEVGEGEERRQTGREGGGLRRSKRG